MKTPFAIKIIEGSAATSLLMVAAVFLLVGFACNSGSKPVAAEYVGAWIGDDGSTITIRADATGDYKAGSTSVSGGAVEIDDAAKTLTIKFVGMGPSFKIDKAPSGNQMTLSGVVYKKGGSSDVKQPDSTTTPNKSDATSGEVPSEGALQALVKNTVLDFNEAVQSDDWSDFHDNLSQPFQKQASPDKLGGVFHEFVEAKINFSGVKNLDAKFTTTPAIETVSGNKILHLKGVYATTPRKTNFELKYLQEDDEWKLNSIEINTKDQ